MTRPVIERHEFRQQGTFAALREAEQWCDDNGYSVGDLQRGAPRGILKGEYAISKWRNLDANDIAALDGQMVGDFRDGPVVVEIFQTEDNS